MYYVFEFGSLALGALVLWKLVSDGYTFHVIGFFVAFLTATIVELAGVRETFSYAYGPFELWVPSGGIGRDVPWFIGVDWAVIFFCFWRLGDRLEMQWYLIPWVFGLIAVFLDLGLDPIASASRHVLELNAPCTDPTLPPGDALGVGYWVWCIPPKHSEEWLGVPLANSYGWFLVVWVFSFFYLWARKVAGTSPIPIQSATLMAAMVASLTVFFTLLNWMLNQNWGTAGWVLWAVFIAGGIIVLASAGTTRKPDTMDWWAMTSVVSITAISVGTYFLKLTAHPQLIMVCGFCLLVSVLLTVWVMRGKFI